MADNTKVGPGNGDEIDPELAERLAALPPVDMAIDPDLIDRFAEINAALDGLEGDERRAASLKIRFDR